MNNHKLIQIPTSDGLFLHGYHAPSVDKKIALLHLHGFEGNFYENNFIYALIREMESKNIGFFTMNTRGNGRETDFNTIAGGYKKIGARYELLEEAHLDISAGLNFLISEGYTELILQGHSLGTMKAVRYLFEGELTAKVNKLILLAPFDKKGYLLKQQLNVEDLLFKAQTMINQGKGEELATNEFGEGTTSYKTFVSWYKQDDLGRMFEFCSPNYEFPILKKIKIPTQIIVGSMDNYFYPTHPSRPDEALDLLLNNIPHSRGLIIKGATHSFKPHEEIMAREVSNFITNYC